MTNRAPVLDRPPTLDGQPPDPVSPDGNSLDVQPALSPDAGSEPDPRSRTYTSDVHEVGDGAEPASPEDPAVQAAEAQDAQARYADAELLGRSYPVRRTVHEAGTRGLKLWQGALAKTRNAIATPGKWVKQFAYDRAQESYERKQARLHLATSQRLKQRRQEKANRAKERADNWGDSLVQHSALMEARTKIVQDNAETRRQEYTEKLKGKRENALARKAVRHGLREEGASRWEARRIVAGMPAEHLDQVGKVAIVAETSRRHHAAADAALEKAVKDRAKTAGQIGSTKERIAEHTGTVEFATRQEERIRTVDIPHAEAQVSELKAALAGIDAKDPRHIELTTHLQLAESWVKTLNKQLGAAAKVRKTSGRKVTQQTSKRDRLTQKHTQQGEGAAAAAVHKHARGQIYQADRSQLRSAVDAALNPTSNENEDDD